MLKLSAEGVKVILPPLAHAVRGCETLAAEAAARLADAMRCAAVAQSTRLTRARAQGCDGPFGLRLTSGPCQVVSKLECSELM